RRSARPRPGGWNMHMSGLPRETRPPEAYLGRPYYEIGLGGLGPRRTDRGLVPGEETGGGKILAPPKPGAKPIAPSEVTPAIRHIGRTTREPTSPALFNIGDKVRMKNIHPPTHTRLPQYVRGHLGTIEHNQGFHVFPDLHSQ